ncbi:MAG: hypothetical protein CMP39_04705 [Rickettsiales bacterium]|nr:hypothetical protein [Rickettsiales bacterium]|tara:strand:- start:3533 stop:4876 length:1344 start_codon:yes stop_codon:yes gene_type:complete
MTKINENDIKNQLNKVSFPGYNKSLVELDFLHSIKINGSSIHVALLIPQKNTSIERNLKQMVSVYLKQLEGVSEVEVDVAVKPKNNTIMDANQEQLKQVSNIIAVSSCKGGVGKSTVSVNLAFALKQRGAKVGILDADIYGPSLPTMVKTSDPLVTDGESIEPKIINGVKCMSFGYSLEENDDQPAILRGPMVSQIVSQFLFLTNWGELDYLIIDLPPGTGDIQLTLCQIIPITAAVIVTTPQHISFIDVVKGIEMFDRLNVPVIGAVENMSHFQDPTTHKKHFPFGKGALNRLVKEFGFANTASLPLHSDVSFAGDNGTPFIEANSHSDIAEIFLTFTDNLIHELIKLSNGQLELPKVGFSKEDGVLIKFNDDVEKAINAKSLRLACQSALNRDEFSNKLITKPDSIPESIYPLSMNPVGNYALGINWSDGHSSLYPYEQLRQLAK